MWWGRPGGVPRPSGESRLDSRQHPVRRHRTAAGDRLLTSLSNASVVPIMRPRGKTNAMTSIRRGIIATADIAALRRVGKNYKSSREISHKFDCRGCSVHAGFRLTEIEGTVSYGLMRFHGGSPHSHDRPCPPRPEGFHSPDCFTDED